MIYGVYAAKDQLSGWLPVSCDSNDSTAIRNFNAALKAPGSIMHFSPDDFRLYKVGTYDSDTGILTSCEPEFLFEGRKDENVS